jgi:hypothetical protein
VTGCRQRQEGWAKEAMSASSEDTTSTPVADRSVPQPITANAEVPAAGPQRAAPGADWDAGPLAELAMQRTSRRVGQRIAEVVAVMLVLAATLVVFGDSDGIALDRMAVWGRIARHTAVHGSGQAAA